MVLIIIKVVLTDPVQNKISLSLRRSLPDILNRNAPLFATAYTFCLNVDFGQVFFSFVQEQLSRDILKISCFEKFRNS